MRIFQRLLASAALLALVGCGGDDIRLATTGRVVKGGAPFTVPADDFVRVTFFPMAADGGSPTTSYAGEYNNADGTFKAVGPDLRGIPPGKYRVGIAHERKRKDLLKGATTSRSRRSCSTSTRRRRKSSSTSTTRRRGSRGSLLDEPEA